MRVIRTTSTVLSIIGLLLPWERENVIFWLYAAIVFSSPAVIPLIAWVAYCVMSTIAMIRQTYNIGAWTRLALLVIATIFFVQRPFGIEIAFNNSGYVITIVAYMLGVISTITSVVSSLLSRRN